MDQLGQILELWKRASQSGEEICLATVVKIEGSAYRRPGARMLLTSAGGRAGTISGGCLEAEVAKKAWWLTESGSSIQRYSSFFDEDGDMPYGLGCGGTVTLLLERGAAAHAALEGLRRCRENRTPSCLVARITSDSPGVELILDHSGQPAFRRSMDAEVDLLAREVLAERCSRSAADRYVEYLAPPPAIYIFGAGDDAKPLVDFTAALGWHVTVADGRANMLRSERFPRASRLTSPEEAVASLNSADSAVLMTHSYDQDRQLLRRLIPMDLKYLGVLGPRLRTERLAGEVAAALSCTATECISKLHSPVGLDLGGHTPASVALSIAAELQASFSGRDTSGRKIAQSVHV